jgi:hypothetical protein
MWNPPRHHPSHPPLPRKHLQSTNVRGEFMTDMETTFLPSTLAQPNHFVVLHLLLEFREELLGHHALLLRETIIVHPLRPVPTLKARRLLKNQLPRPLNFRFENVRCNHLVIKELGESVIITFKILSLLYRATSRTAV